jgi:hypothetical protein
MAQSGYTPIQLYSSSTAAALPIAGNLAAGELAINTVDEKLYFKNSAGVVKLLASNAAAAGTVSSVAATVPSFLSVAGSPITTSGTLAISFSGTALPVANGGSGATTASAALTNFGATTLGGNLYTITNPSAVTFPRFNADNTVSSLDAATFRTAIGAGTGGGSVSSVAGTGSANGLTLSGTVTSTGNITLGGSVTSLTTTNFTIVEESGKLVIKYGATVIASFSSAGALISADNVTAYGTP